MDLLHIENVYDKTRQKRKRIISSGCVILHVIPKNSFWINWSIAETVNYIFSRRQTNILYTIFYVFMFNVH